MAVQNKKLRKQVKKYWPDAALIAGLVLAVCISAWVSVLSGEGHWFQRSGAVMVLLAAMLEFRQSKVMNDARDNAVVIEPIVLTNVPRDRKALHVVALVLIVAGTFVWGYGDLVFSVLR